VVEFNRRWLDAVPNPRDERSDDPAYRDGVDRLLERNRPELIPVWYWTAQLNALLPRFDEQLRGTRFVTRIAAGFTG
jgi:hypothetical protein